MPLDFEKPNKVRIFRTEEKPEKFILQELRDSEFDQPEEWITIKTNLTKEEIPHNLSDILIIE